METSLDKFGRVVIPKRLREQLGLQPGTALTVRQQDGRVILEQAAEEPVVVDKDGVLVFVGQAAAELGDAVAADRQRRMRRASGLQEQ